MWRWPWGKREDDLEEEIAAHLEIEAAQQRSYGLDPDAARASARRAFGNRTRIAEDTRDVWRIGWLDDLWQDLRIGLRTLRHAPGFTLAATLVLALGIGPNTALYSIVHSAFFDTLGFPDPDRLVTVQYAPQGDPVHRGYLRMGDVYELQRNSASFESITVTVGGFGTSYTLGEGASAIVLRTEPVQPGHLTRTIGIQPVIGRDFLPEESQPGREFAVILSHKVWTSRFDGNPAIIGRQIRLSLEPIVFFSAMYTVVGVMPPLRGVGGGQPDLWFPLPFHPGDAHRHGMDEFGRAAMARLKPGVTIAQARAEVAALAAQSTYKGRPLEALVEPLSGYQMPDATGTTLWILAATAVFVLLLACANFSSLMIARGTLRQHELWTRLSLGASNWRIFRQLAVETMIVVTIGSAMGIALAWGLLELLVRQLPAIAALSAATPTLSRPVLIGTTFVGLVAALFFGCLPMWRASRPAHHNRAPWRRALVACEFAAATALLASSVVTGHRLWLKTQGNSGMHGMDRVLVFNHSYSYRDWSVRHAHYRDVAVRLLAIPGVEFATNSPSPLIAGLGARFEVPGLPPPPEGARVMVQTIGAGYFPTIGTRVLSGRAIDERDTPTSERVVMVNEAFVRRYFGSVNPLGAHVVFEEGFPQRRQWVTRRIVGIYPALVRTAQTLTTPLEVAIPNDQFSETLSSTLMARAQTDVNAIRKPIVDMLRDLDPLRPPPRMETLDELASNLALRERGYAILFGLLGALGLVLSASGIYGLMTFLVARRTKEIGVRMAMGATPQRVTSMILREGITWAIVGVAVGFIGAYFASQSLQTVLGNTWGLAYYAFAAAALLLLASAAAACLLPALRASRVDPVAALRVD